jgi:hypothetical protein
VAGTSRTGILRVSCCADKLRSPEYLPALCYGSLAKSAPAPEPQRPVDMGTDSSTCKGVLASTPNPSSLAERTLRRQIPKVGARCVNHARRDLCGGCSAMSIPTAIDQALPPSRFEPLWRPRERPYLTGIPGSDVRTPRPSAFRALLAWMMFHFPPSGPG